MIDLKIVLAIILIHWLADFVFQTDKMAKGKSKNWSDLLNHTGTYSVIWLILGLTWVLSINMATSNNYLFDYKNVILFSFITFIAHTITDYFTSRLNSKLWAKGDVHNFFVSIGGDQVLHYTQLLLTYYILTK